jgi:hypothetical protein
MSLSPALALLPVQIAIKIWVRTSFFPSKLWCSVEAAVVPTAVPAGPVCSVATAVVAVSSLHVAACVATEGSVSEKRLETGI